LEDDYQIGCDQKSVVGSGYNGAVRLGTSKGRKSFKVAVKAFALTNLAADEQTQLTSEVEILLCMDHPHIVRLYDVYETEDSLSLVMECMEGGQLLDRVIELKRFSEHNAAVSLRQMLLGLNYIHSHGIVHRDLKLENFLYDNKNSDHLKLIDFGFSKIWDPHVKMHVSCGTLSYTAPEVLKKSYTNKCDMWSLGVIAFILLAGYMPFSGSESVRTKDIRGGKLCIKPEKWETVSKQAMNFVLCLMRVNPDKRLSAQQALEHEWISTRHEQKGHAEVDLSVVTAFRSFAHASRFRRCCMEMMAWSLSNEERSQVREYFLELDQNHHGTISISELKTVLEDKFHIHDKEVQEISRTLDTNHDGEIHYSDFLAAMLSTRIRLHDDLLPSTFKRFDTDNSGYITSDNLKEVLGDAFEGEEVGKLVAEADQLQDGRISYVEFVAFVKGEKLGTAGTDFRAVGPPVGALRALNGSRH